MCSARKRWDFTQTSRSFYDDEANQRLADVQREPEQASLLQPREPSIRSRSPSASAGHVDRAAVYRDSLSMHKVREAPEEKLTMALKYVFELFNRWEGGVNRSRMNKIRFHKVLRCDATPCQRRARHICQGNRGTAFVKCLTHVLRGCRDTRLMCEQDLTSGEADRVFQKVKPQSQEAVNFVQFMEALRHCAMVKRISLNEIVHRIVALGGPIEVTHR